MKWPKAVKNPIKKTFNSIGYNIHKIMPVHEFPLDFDQTEIEDVRSVRPYTMTSALQIISMFDAIKYICANKIGGSIVECGVWKGGSMMIAARVLKRQNGMNRDLYLFDTFAGMPEPGKEDTAYKDFNAPVLWKTNQSKSGPNQWNYGSLEEVRANVASTGYPMERVHFVKGKVEDTIPGTIPERIAILRLDTDFYESTLHELKHLYPRLTPGGILIIDDYGCWKGARKATDEYIAEHKLPIFLARQDQEGRIAIKPY